MTDIQSATDEQIVKLEQLLNAIDFDDPLEIMLTKSEAAFYKLIVDALPALVARIRAESEEFARYRAAMNPDDDQTYISLVEKPLRMWKRRAEVAESRAARLAEALRFYAEGWPTGVANDGGEHARVALATSDAQIIQTENSLMTTPRLLQKKEWDAQIIADLLKSMSDGQGDAMLFVSWDSAIGNPAFDVTSHRERDGEFLERFRLTEQEFITLIEETLDKVNK